MDREQIIEDLKTWLAMKQVQNAWVTPQEVLTKIVELEEEYE